MLKKNLFLLLSLLFIPFLAFAHQPRLVEENFVEVQNPEVSQAFYAELTGEPAYYKIESDHPFNLYLGILVPDILGIDKDVSAEVYLEKNGQKEALALLDGLNHSWPSYHEEFANDYYFWGPEFKAENSAEFTTKGKPVEAGNYLIKIFSPDNQGKYVFVVGEKEEFPFKEILNTVKILPKIKADFFGKSAYSAFFNRIGFYIFAPLLTAVVFLILAAFITIKIFKKHS